MPLKSILRRRLLSLLEPWLREEPELDLRLGLFNSLLVANNLSFDVSALNQLFDEPACLFFKDVTVERLSVRFSSWDTPAFTIEVHGVRIVLSFEKPEGDKYTKRSRRSTYDYSENLTEKLSALDPEGCDLHHLLERILFAVPSRKAFTSSILNLILKHCHLEAHSIHLEIQFPVLNDMFVCFGEMKEFSAKSRYLDQRCLLRGFLHVIFLPLRESSFTLYGIGLKVGFNSNDRTDRVLLSSDLCSFMNLRDLKLADCSLCFPELAFSFSPEDISIYLAFNKLLSSKYNCARSARELWRIAASRIGQITLTPRSSLHLLVGIIVQWVRYVNAYEDLLLVIGYSIDLLSERSNSKICNNKMGLGSAIHHWEVISDLEKKLPVEGIALARRIARHRAELKVKSGDYEQCSTSSPFKFFYHFLHLLSLSWSVILKTIQFVANILFLGKGLVQDPDIDGHLGSLAKDPCQRRCFVLNFGKIVVTVSQINEIQPSVYEKLQSHPGISYSNFHSVCLSIDALLLVSIEDIFGHKQILSCGQMKFKIAPLTMSPETSTMNLLSSVEGNRRGGINDMEPILWVDPAKAFLLSDSASHTESFSSSYLENLLGKIYLSCKGICSTFDESEIEYSDNPCLLCKVERSFVYPGLMNPDFGFYECGLMLGKLNIALTLSSLISLSLLLSPIQHSIFWEHKEKSSVDSDSLDKPEISWVNEYKCYAQQLIRTFLGMLPEKQIQFGAFVDGPCVRFLKEANIGGHDNKDIVSQDGFDLSFDFDDIEVAASAPFVAMAPFTDQLGFDKTEAEYLMLEPQAIEIPKPNNQKYASWGNISIGFYLRLNGLNASLGTSAEEHQIKLFVLKPITVQLSSFREYIYSLSTTIVAFSSSWGIMAGGCTVLLFLDELYMIYEAVASLSSAVSYLFGSFEASDCIPSKIMKQVLLMEPAIEEATVGGNQWTNSGLSFLLNGICRLESVDVVLHTSRRINDVESCMRTFDLLTGNKLAEQKLPHCGIWNSIQKTTIVISCEEEKMDLLIDVSGITSLVFKYQNYIGKDNDHIVLKSLLLQSVNCLHEITLSDCVFTVSLGPPQNANALSSGYESKIRGRLNDQFNNLVKKIGCCTNMLAPASATYWLVINVAVGNAFIGKCSLKNDLVRAHRLNKLLSVLSVGGELLTISWEIQGGHIILETTTLAVTIDSYSLYLSSIGSLASAAQHNKRIIKAEHDEVSDNCTDGDIQHTPCIPQRAERRLPDAFSLSVSRAALVVVLENELGGLQELVLEVDIHLKFELATAGRKLMFDLLRLSVLSQILHESVEDEAEIPHFTSVTLKDSSSPIASGDPCSKVQSPENFQSIDDASSSRNPVPLKGDFEYSFVSDVFHLSHQNSILKDLRAFISLERPENVSLHLSRCWFGSGSLSGFEMTLSVSEIQTILSMVTSLSSAFSLKTTKELGSNHGPTRQEFEDSFEEMVPDGAIVAIQDISQHMYLTVEDGERNFSIGGTIHYSLVGERALFKVKHCMQRRWKSTILWFSLISLYAKNGKGEPLRLNYSPGSCFVDISCTNDGGSALWRVHPCEGGSSKGVTDWEASNQLVKRTFYLVNKKNDSAIAFVDGVPEFFSKPGNPFKFKVFHDLSVVRNVTEPSNYHGRASQASVHMDQERISWKTLPRIDIKIEKISLNIVHELSETEDFVPLIRGCINNTQLIIQSLETKSRVMSTSTAVVHYFDTQRNLWGELLYPVDIYIFCRSNFQTQRSEYAPHAVPVNFYCKTKELNISLSELSLDTLLFMIGKLNLSGPYSLRSSLILPYCCKVVNQSGLNLLFHFNQQRIAIARKQSSSISLRRHSVFMTQDSEVATDASIQLADTGSFTTSLIHLSLSEGQAIAWRTRIMPIEGSKTYPGPFLVVNISRKAEDGLSVVVSPLIRIHNETGFPMELQFQRSEAKEEEFASVLLKPGDSIDDSMAMFDAIKFSGGIRKALMSLSVGNFLFSFRPEMTGDLINSRSSLSVDWSDHIKGGKAIRLSGIFDKLNYRIRKALFVKSVRCSFSTAHCILKSDSACVGSMHFLIQTISRDVPVSSPEESNENLPVSLQNQKEIYILPTVRMTNLLHSEINVLLSETDQSNPTGYDRFGKQATILCGSTVEFYANPTVIYFTVTLATFNLTSKPVNSGNCVKKLLKQNNEVQHLDIDLDFDGGNFFATLRLYRGNRGMLEAVIFTSYSLKNDTDFPVYVLAAKRRPVSRIELDNLDSSIPLELGLCLPPKSTRSWFLKSKKVQLKLLEDHTSEALLDLDALSGLTEISFDKEEGSRVKSIIKLGVSTGPSSEEIVVPSQAVTLVPRYVICNESEGCITVRQCYLQDDAAGTISINSKQRATLQLKEVFNKKREFSLFENFIRKHRSSSDNSLLYIQFQTNEPGLGWSGPVCIASLGRFFLKFRKLINPLVVPDSNITQFAAVHVVEEGSTLVLHFHKPPNMSLPYRIENCLHDLSITYYQKGSIEPEVLGSSCCTDYVWDDLTLPHKLVVRINDSLQLREIKLDKVGSWKPFYKVGQQRVLAPRLLPDKRSGDQRVSFAKLNDVEMAKVGYEVYADGPTRVLRICEISDSFKRDTVLNLFAKFQLRVSQLAVHLLEQAKQEGDGNEPQDFTPFTVARFGNLSLITVSDNDQKYYQFNVQYLNFELKWTGAPYASMLRRHQLDYIDANDSVLNVAFVLLASGSNVKQVRYSSIFLQPIDLNLDEETLMKIASFSRMSLSNSESQRFYFDHFEIHPIKITANFIPGDSHSNYSSAQETLRSLLHSVVKVPPIKNRVVELNGVLITHALITVHELCIKCAQHYSWYAMRAIYIAKGSPLLPPDFVSIFDDSASSSLDVFFDPSHGLTSLPGFTLGTFKLISKCIKGEGFSGTKRYFGDLGKTLRSAGSNVAFSAVAEISDSVLKGAEANGFNGMVNGFHQGILKLAMEPSFLGAALMEGGPDRKITLDQSPGVDELYIEGYIQAMLDTVYRQEYLRVRVIDNQVILKNLPPNHSLINEITGRVKEFLVSEALLKGDPSKTSRPLRHLHGESEWKIGAAVLTLCEHLLVSFAIRMLRRKTNKFVVSMKSRRQSEVGDPAVDSTKPSPTVQKVQFIWKWGIGKFVLSGILAYIDGRLCRCIPNPVARRVVSGFLLSYIDQKEDE